MIYIKKGNNDESRENYDFEGYNENPAYKVYLSNANNLQITTNRPVSAGQGRIKNESI